MATIERRLDFRNAKSRSSVLPTLTLAILAWTGIFGLTLALWWIVDLLR